MPNHSSTQIWESILTRGTLAQARQLRRRGLALFFLREAIGLIQSGLMLSLVSRWIRHVKLTEDALDKHKSAARSSAYFRPRISKDSNEAKPSIFVINVNIWPRYFVMSRRSGIHTEQSVDSFVFGNKSFVELYGLLKSQPLGVYSTFRTTLVRPLHVNRIRGAFDTIFETVNASILGLSIAESSNICTLMQISGCMYKVHWISKRAAEYVASPADNPLSN